LQCDSVATLQQPDAKTDTAKKSPSELPTAECGLLYGMAMIGRWMPEVRSPAKCAAVAAWMRSFEGACVP